VSAHEGESLDRLVGQMPATAACQSSFQGFVGSSAFAAGEL
jgi:hypothetical protein